MRKRKCTLCGMKSRGSSRCPSCGVRFESEHSINNETVDLFTHYKIDTLSANYIDVQNIRASVIKAGYSIDETIHAAKTLSNYGIK